MSSYLILAIVSLTIINIRDVFAGKGKAPVPIYMPIPIPIPMPVGPVHPGKHQHSVQSQEQSGDSDGEVKKIYLFQPMNRLQPQPNLKGGGFMGPVQNNIHLQTPANLTPVRKIRQQQEHEHVKQTELLNGDSGVSINQIQEHSSLGTRGSTDSYGDTKSRSHQSSSGSDLKILPIVVIPPMAPMPPIQLHNNNQEPPRMTLSPQFNNYLVTSNKRSHQSKPYGLPANQQQDYQTFADYGSSLSGSTLRSSFDRSHRAFRLKPSMSRMSRRPSRADQFLEEHELGQSSWKTRERRQDPWRRGDNYRRLDLINREPLRRTNHKSINDIVESKIIFDDDPLPEASNEMRDSTPLRDYEDQEESHRVNNHPQHTREEQPRIGINSRRNLELVDMRDDGDSMSSSIGIEAESFRRQHDSDLNPIYYDRDIQTPVRPQSHRSHESDPLSWTRINSSNDIDTKRNQLDDEWRFESIKSVSHASPVAEPKKPNSTSTSKNHFDKVPAKQLLKS